MTTADPLTPPKYGKCHIIVFFNPSLRKGLNFSDIFGLSDEDFFFRKYIKNNYICKIW